jgi:hypothetical protein
VKIDSIKTATNFTGLFLLGLAAVAIGCMKDAPTSNADSAISFPPELPQMDFRQFTLRADTAGGARSVEAKVIGFAGNIVRLQKQDGRVAGVEIETLVAADQAWLESHFGDYRRQLLGQH